MSYLPLAETGGKKSSLKKLKRYLSLGFPIAFFFFAVWLTFVRFHKSPIGELQEFIEKKEYQKAYKALKPYLEDESISKANVAMYGFIIKMGLNEIGTDTSSLPDFYTLLKSKDSTGVFYKEAILKSAKLFPESARYADFICNYYQHFKKIEPDTMSLFNQGINTDSEWLYLSQSCVDTMFNAALFSSRLGVVKGDKLKLRQGPSLDTQVVDKLAKSTNVFIRKQGAKLTIAGSTHHWYYIFTEDQKQGWVYGRYINKL